MTETDKQQIITAALNEVKPVDALSHAVLFAKLKGKELVTQKEYAEAAEISDRTLRGYIQKHRKEYEKALETAEAELAAKLNPLSSSRKLSESDLDVFISSLITAAISPTATVRDRSLLIDFAGLKSEDILSLSASKDRKLLWYVKNNLSTISKYLDSRSLGIMLEGSDLLNRDDTRDSHNKQNFIDSDISSEQFKLEMVYQGLLFGSIWNEAEHPDLSVVAAAVRLQRSVDSNTEQLSKGKYELKHYVAGKDVEETAAVERSEEETAAEIERLMLEIFDGNVKEYEESKARRKTFSEAVKPPKIDKAAVRQRESEYSEDLKVIATFEEFKKDLFSN